MGLIDRLRNIDPCNKMQQGVSAYIDSANYNLSEQKQPENSSTRCYIFENEKLKGADLHQVCHNWIDFVGPMFQQI